jgi:hypothetical protein
MTSSSFARWPTFGQNRKTASKFGHWTKLETETFKFIIQLQQLLCHPIIGRNPFFLYLHSTATGTFMSARRQIYLYCHFFDLPTPRDQIPLNACMPQLDRENPLSFRMAQALL